jgi:hypothetical protein
MCGYFAARSALRDPARLTANRAITIIRMHPFDLSRRGLSMATEIVSHGWPRYVSPLLRELIVRHPCARSSQAFITGRHFIPAFGSR